MKGSLLLALGLTGCQLSGQAEASLAHSTLTIYAASSLTEAVVLLEHAYEARNPGVDVIVSLAGSQTLRLQLAQGAPADVFLSADPDPISALAHEGRVTTPTPFAQNALALVVPAANPAGITGLDDLGQAERLVIGTPGSPIGRYTHALLDRAAALYGPGHRQDVLDSVVSEESNVRQARAKVLLGEADAAVVYETDTRVDGLRVLPLPDELQVPADYSAAAVTDSTVRPQALDFVGFLGSLEGLACLAAAGLGPPAP